MPPRPRITNAAQVDFGFVHNLSKRTALRTNH